MPYADRTSEVARECERRSKRKFYYAHREAEIERSKKWAREHAEQVNANQKAWRRGTLTHKVLFNNAKQRARKYGIEFTITPDDVVVPERCPVFGFTFCIGDGSAKDNSPSIDRIDPMRGYVPGNIAVISHRANTMKSNATAEEVRALLSYMERKHG